MGEVEVADVVPRVKAQRDKDGRIKNGERETGKDGGQKSVVRGQKGKSKR